MKSDLSLSQALTKQQLVSPVAEDLAKVEAELKSYTDTAYPLIDEINLYLHDSGGKRFRPTVLLLVSKICGVGGDKVVKLGTVVELIHVATLVHDDIIDKANLRRGHLSVNARWGNEITVLMGDWMYMTAFQLALELRNFRVLDVLIQLTRTMVTGEMMQLDLNRMIETSIEDQLEICQRKTAQLFSACTSLPAMLAGASSEVEAKLAAYGKAVGMAFQLTDDMLDYTADQSGIGKPVMKDLEEGKVTLPIILLFQKANRVEREFISRVAVGGKLGSKEKLEIVALVQRYHTLNETRAMVRDYASQAVEILSDFPDSPALESLMYIPAYILDRMD